MNLISNAVKYGGSGTEVSISVRQCRHDEAIAEALEAGASDLNFVDSKTIRAMRGDKKKVTVISVRDHGRGIPMKEMGSLFGEFVQLEVSKEVDCKYASKGAHIVGQTSGSGLGLHLVLKFVTMMGGNIWAQNCDSGGAIFSFCFLQGGASAVGDESTLNSIQPIEAELEEEDCDMFNVLVVDDSSKFSSLLRTPHSSSHIASFMSYVTK